MCDIETEVSLIVSRELSLAIVEFTLTLFSIQDFTFGVVNEEDVPAYMGDIVIPADTDGLQDGDLLCHLLHPPAGAALNAKPQASAGTPPANVASSPAAGGPASAFGGAEYQTMPRNGMPTNQSPAFDPQSQQVTPPPTYTAPVSQGHAPETPVDSNPPLELDQSLYTRAMPIRMPNMGKYDGKCHFQ